jgi:hypothetical protein
MLSKIIENRKMNCTQIGGAVFLTKYTIKRHEPGRLPGSCLQGCLNKEPNYLGSLQFKGSV